jgi:hypothetical protein
MTVVGVAVNGSGLPSIQIQEYRYAVRQKHQLTSMGQCNGASVGQRGEQRSAGTNGREAFQVENLSFWVGHHGRQGRVVGSGPKIAMFLKSFG